MWDLLNGPVSDILAKTGATLASATILGYIHVRDKVNKLESQVQQNTKLLEEKKETISAISMSHAEHAERLAVIETVLEDLKELAPALRGILSLTTKMDVILEHTTRRIDLLEEHVLRKH